LDLAPLDDAELERSVEELRGDVRDPGAAARLVDGADVLVHAAAALPIQASRDSIRSVNVEGAAVTLAAALEAGVGRTVLISSTAVYGIPKHHPLREDAPLVGVGHYGESKIEAERVARRAGRRGLEVVILRPKTFIGPDRARRLGQPPSPGARQARGSRPAGARAGAALAARRVALPHRPPRLLCRRLEGAEAARLQTPPLERAGALRDLRLVPRKPRR